MTIVGLVPAVLLPIRFALDRLGANPIEAIAHITGEWTLRLILLTLTVTPLRRLTGWAWLAPQRRTLGLLAFTYACLHLATYVGLDLFFEWSHVAEDILERPYITVGFASFLLMVPLALTSTRATMRRLGRRWNRLHALVYAVAIGGVVHYTWQVKADLSGPLLHWAALAVLLGIRGFWWIRTTRRA